MSKGPTIASDRDALAASDDVKRVLGELDDAKVLDILALRPTILDVEEASLWLSADNDIFGAGHPLKRVAGEIVVILTADDEDD